MMGANKYLVALCLCGSWSLEIHSGVILASDSSADADTHVYNNHQAAWYDVSGSDDYLHHKYEQHEQHEQHMRSVVLSSAVVASAVPAHWWLRLSKKAWLSALSVSALGGYFAHVWHRNRSFGDVLMADPFAHYMFQSRMGEEPPSEPRYMIGTKTEDYHRVREHVSVNAGVVPASFVSFKASADYGGGYSRLDDAKKGHKQLKVLVSVFHETYQKMLQERPLAYDRFLLLLEGSLEILSALLYDPYFLGRDVFGLDKHSHNPALFVSPVRRVFRLGEWSQEGHEQKFYASDLGVKLLALNEHVMDYILKNELEEDNDPFLFELAYHLYFSGTILASSQDMFRMPFDKLSSHPDLNALRDFFFKPISHIQVQGTVFDGDSVDISVMAGVVKAFIQRLVDIREGLEKFDLHYVSSFYLFRLNTSQRRLKLVSLVLLDYLDHHHEEDLDVDLDAEKLRDALTLLVNRLEGVMNPQDDHLRDVYLAEWQRASPGGKKSFWQALQSQVTPISEPSYGGVEAFFPRTLSSKGVLDGVSAQILEGLFLAEYVSALQKKHNGDHYMDDYRFSEAAFLAFGQRSQATVKGAVRGVKVVDLQKRIYNRWLQDVGKALQWLISS